MSFDEDLEDAYYLGIRPALQDCGYVSIFMKEVTTNKGVTDRILAEIRQAQFVIADFTQHRNGCYFEAGFAQALGREVIWCCRDTDFDKLHFDTRHLGHIKWSQPADLKQKLSDAILALIGRGPMGSF